MHKYLAEFIGTFFLMLTIGCAVVGGAGVLTPLAIGSILMVMIFAGGHISGGHYNPAVTLAVFLRGRCPISDVGPYMAAQVLGAACAAWLTPVLTGPSAVAAHVPLLLPTLVAEALWTCALAYVVLNVATAKGTAGNSFYGLAIGMTVMVGATIIGPISGGAFNPAVAVGASMLGLFSWSNLWIYLVAHFIGGAVAAFLFVTLNPEDRLSGV
ncbi:MAG: aquaporin [Candidatus Omnitrophica bacterium]|nr:aquaporin [Candidatus Omnitrophota bacterium]MBI2173931.1 aquaporin [Candidatus Omnitrophota bacterium]MBI3009891.1 aquaporin [Candidatus Omnitrophota bacterium]